MNTTNSNCITCNAHQVKDDTREWEITPDGRVWPCCFFANAWDKRRNNNDNETKRLMEDKVIWNLLQTDPEWNSLNTHELDDIVNHKVFWTHIWYTGWESDNPPPICLKECSNNKAQLNIRKHNNRGGENGLETREYVR